MVCVTHECESRIPGCGWLALSSSGKMVHFICKFSIVCMGGQSDNCMQAQVLSMFAHNNLIITFYVHSHLTQWCPNVLELVDCVVFGLLCGRGFKVFVVDCSMWTNVDGGFTCNPCFSLILWISYDTQHHLDLGLQQLKFNQSFSKSADCVNAWHDWPNVPFGATWLSNKSKNHICCACETIPKCWNHLSRHFVQGQHDQTWPNLGFAKRMICSTLKHRVQKFYLQTFDIKSHADRSIVLQHCLVVNANADRLGNCDGGCDILI